MKKIIYLLFFVSISIFHSCKTNNICFRFDIGAGGKESYSHLHYMPTAYELIEEGLSKNPVKVLPSGAKVYEEKGKFLCLVFDNSIIYKHDGKVWHFLYDNIEINENLIKNKRKQRKKIQEKSTLVNEEEYVKVLVGENFGRAILINGQEISLEWSDISIEKISL